MNPLRPSLEQPADGEEAEPAERQVEFLPHVVARDAEEQAEPHVGEPDRLQHLREDEHRTRCRAQMLMLKYGVLSTITYFKLKRCRPSIFTTVAHMFTTRKPVRRNRGQPQRSMKSSKS